MTRITTVSVARILCAGMVTLPILLLALCAPAWSAEESDPDKISAELMEMEIEGLTSMKVMTVTGASRYEQKVSEAPSAVTIITAEQIWKYGYRTLADIIRSVRSFYVYSDRSYTYMGVRGFGLPADYSTRVLLLVDGHRINDNIYNMAPIGNEFPLDVDLIERVEVIRGPGSSLYGSNAVFAVINVISKSGRVLAGAEVSGSAASFDTYKGRLTYGNRFANGLEAVVSASGLDSRGPSLYYREFDDLAHNNGVANHIDYEQSQNALVKLSFHDFTLEGAYQRRPKGLGSAWWGVDYNQPGNKIIDTRQYLDLKYESPLGEHFDLLARLNYDVYRYDAHYLYGGAVNRDVQQAEWWGGEVKVATKAIDKHRIIAGAEFQDNLHRKLKNYDEEPYHTNSDLDRKSTNWALYLQDEYALLANLTINAGFRFDHYSEFGNTTNPRLAIIYKPFEQTAIKLLYGSAFRVPNMWETSYEFPAYAKGNDRLKPEKITTYEFVCEQYLGKHLKATATGFYYTLSNIILQESDPADNLLVYRNSGKVNTKGAEFELEGTWAKGLEGKVSYSYQEARDAQTDEALQNSPAHMAKANLKVPLLGDKFSAGIEEQYLSSRKTPAGNHTGDVLITNLTIAGKEIVKGLDISGSLYNLFDKKYGDPTAPGYTQDVIPMDGRTFRVKLTYRF